MPIAYMSLINVSRFNEFSVFLLKDSVVSDFLKWPQMYGLYGQHVPVVTFIDSPLGMKCENC